MFSDIGIAVDHFFKAFTILRKPWAIKYVIASALISLFTAIAFIYLAFQFGDNLGNYLFSLIPVESNIEWLNTVFEWISRILLWLSIIFLFKYIYLLYQEFLREFKFLNNFYYDLFANLLLKHLNLNYFYILL